MDTQKIIDIGIGVVQALVGCALSWQAFIVSITELPKATRRKNKAIFATCCLLVIALSGVQTYRGFGLDQKLDVIESNTAKSPQHTQIDAPIPISPTGTTPTPFRDNQQEEFNVSFINTGAYPVLSETDGVVITAVNVSDLAVAFTIVRSTLKFELGGGRINPAPDNLRWNSIYSKPLSHSDVIALKQHKKLLCAIGAIDWTDTTGEYETDLYDCYIEEADHTFQWHVLPETNREIKIK
jgi:hypothetical protein